MAELLVSRGARVTQSHMLLHCAVTQANTDMARLLLNTRSVPNLRDDHGNTPLLLAAKQVFLKKFEKFSRQKLMRTRVYICICMYVYNFKICITLYYKFIII